MLRRNRRCSSPVPEAISSIWPASSPSPGSCPCPTHFTSSPEMKSLLRRADGWCRASPVVAISPRTSPLEVWRLEEDGLVVMKARQPRDEHSQNASTPLKLCLINSSFRQPAPSRFLWWGVGQPTCPWVHELNMAQPQPRETVNETVNFRPKSVTTLCVVFPCRPTPTPPHSTAALRSPQWAVLRLLGCEEYEAPSLVAGGLFGCACFRGVRGLERRLRSNLADFIVDGRHLQPTVGGIEVRPTHTGSTEIARARTLSSNITAIQRLSGLAIGKAVGRALGGR